MMMVRKMYKKKEEESENKRGRCETFVSGTTSPKTDIRRSPPSLTPFPPSLPVLQHPSTHPLTHLFTQLTRSAICFFIQSPNFLPHSFLLLPSIHPPTHSLIRLFTQLIHSPNYLIFQTFTHS